MNTRITLIRDIINCNFVLQRINRNNLQAILKYCSKLIRVFTTISLLIVCIQIITGQNNQIIFQNLQNGLSNKFIRCILKDSKGFMWFGTYNGLNKYDGTNFTIYEHNPDDSASICHNVINGIYEDRDHNLWIATAEGLSLYNRDYDNFIDVNNLKGNTNHLNNVYLTSIFVDQNGIVWTGTIGGGLNSYNRKTQTFEYYSFSTADDQTSDFINCITPLNEKLIWIGTRRGLFLFDILDREQHTIPYHRKDNIGLENKHIVCMTKDNSDNLWIADKEGNLYRLTNITGRIHIEPCFPAVQEKLIIPGRIIALNCDTRNNLYIGKENYGLLVYNTVTTMTQFYAYDEKNPNGIACSSIWSIYPDSLGKLWIGTYNKGVCLFDPFYKKFDSYQRNLYQSETLASDNVKAFSADGIGRVWIGTDGGGISIFDPEKYSFVKSLSTRTNPKLSTDAVMSIIHASDGTAWIGCWAGGVDRLDMKADRIVNYSVTSNGPGDNNILCLYEDDNHTIWAGTAGSGLFRFEKEINKFRQVTDSADGICIPVFSFVTSVLQDSEGNIWVGTLYGLFSLKELSNGKYTCHEFYYNDTSNSISSNRITVIFEDHKNILWFGTFDNGLNRYDKKNNTFTSYQKKDGLASNTICGILEDKHSCLWISTNRGITKFDPENRKYQVYSSNDGLVTDEFNTGACLGIAGNKLFYGGDNGFNIINPEYIPVNPVRPKMYLTGLLIDNKIIKPGKNSPLIKDISSTRNITLTHYQTSFAIEYAGVGYTRTSENHYKYKLEGFNKEWIDADNNTSAAYTNVPPGKYNFLVRGANNDGVWSNLPARLQIQIKPPFWKTWWAYIFYVILISSALYLGFQLRIDRIKIKNSLAMERMAHEKDQELAQAKLQFFTNISHELRTPLSLILGPLESILNSEEGSTKIKSKIQIVQKNASRLMQLVNELMDFRKIENRKMNLRVQETDISQYISEIASCFNMASRKKNIDFTVIHSEKNIKGFIDRNKLEKIVNNILSNAFRYTPDGGTISIVTNIEYQTCNDLKENAPINNTSTIRYCKIEVYDNGKGILAEDLPFIFDRFFQAKSSADQGTGIGLTLVKSLVDIHHGTIKAKSIPGQKTVFTICLPIDKIAYADDEVHNGTMDITEFSSGNTSSTDELPEMQLSDSIKTEKPELLIVEDNEELRNYLENELKTSFRISVAHNGKEGLEQALSGMPDMVISDIMMPGINGIELCRRLKTDTKTSHIPVILLTAKSAIEDQIEGLEEGADAYITKPFSIRILKAQINQMVNNRKGLYSRFSQDVHILPSMYARNKLDQEFLATVINYIVKNISNNQLGVEQLGDTMNLSRSQIYKKIKALTGKTAVEFIRCIRLKEAVKLMETRKYTLSEIAYETGFTSPSYFTRSFKHQYGKAPSDYMKV